MPVAVGTGSLGRPSRPCERTSLANNSQVVNIPGAGGTIGLGKFSTMGGQADTILATGTAMVGGIALNKSPVGFDDTTLLARVAEDYDVLIAAADSPYDTIDDVVSAWKKDPEGFVWTGGSRRFRRSPHDRSASTAGRHPRLEHHLHSQIRRR